MGKLIGSLEKQLTVEGEEINGYMDKMRRCSERGDLLSELLLILWQDYVSPVTSYICLPMPKS